VAFIQISENFSQTVLALQGGDRSVMTQITFGGDLSNPYYMVGVNLALTAVEGYVQAATGQPPLVQYVEQPLGASAARTEFETYVPGTLIFAVIMLIFLASMTVAREIENGTLRRLQLTHMTSLDLLGGVTAALVLVGTAAFTLAFVCALAVGFRSQGPVWAALLVGAVTCLSVIGVGMLVASFTRSVSQAFVVANFPMAMMMFFSGVIYPLPKIVMFTLAGREIGLYDILPATHAVAALNKILTLGADLGQVTYELWGLVLLSGLYLCSGVWVFNRLHLRG
jgi:ABC-2 type transport system permease protein